MAIPSAKIINGKVAMNHLIVTEVRASAYFWSRPEYARCRLNTILTMRDLMYAEPTRKSVAAVDLIRLAGKTDMLWRKAPFR